MQPSQRELRQEAKKSYPAVLLDTSPSLSKHLDDVLEELKKRKIIKQKHTLLFIYGKIISDVMPKNKEATTEQRWEATDFNNIKFWKTFTDYVALNAEVHKNDLFFRLRDIHIHSVSGLKYYPNDPV